MRDTHLSIVATDYVIAVWSLNEVKDIDALFDEDMLGDDLEAWMDDSSMRMTFRNVSATWADRTELSRQKETGQVTSSDLIYDTLRQHEPDHILLRATRRCGKGTHGYSPPWRYVETSKRPHPAS